MQNTTSCPTYTCANSYTALSFISFLLRKSHSSNKPLTPATTAVHIEIALLPLSDLSVITGFTL